MNRGWTNERRRLLYGEARAVLQLQNEAMRRIEDKAIRVLRLNAIPVGLLFAMIQFDLGLFRLDLTVLGIAAFVTSGFAGIVTLDDSNLFAGVTGSYLLELDHDETMLEPWDANFLYTLAGMIDANHRDIRRSTGTLRLTNGLLVTGIGAVFASMLL